jgi:diguanylate cyclase (GGDEF)-like protein
MLLVGPGGSQSLDASGANANSGDVINLHFSVPTQTGEQHFRMEAIICRVLNGGTGLGVRFEQPLDGAAFSVLMEFAVASGMVSRTAAKLAAGEEVPELENGKLDEDGDVPEILLRDKRISPQDAGKVKEQLRRIAGRAVNRVTKSFFEHCDRELLVKARDAGTNAMQMMYFEGLDQLEQRREEVRNRFGKEALDQIDHVSELEVVLEYRRRRETGSNLKLELVDTEEFEDWLAVAEVITKAENRHADVLLEIRTRLGMLAKPWSHKDVVPIGPAALVWAFADALKEVDVRRQVKQDVYRIFEQSLAPVLETLYDAVTKMLEDSGVFPSLDEMRTAMRGAELQRRRVFQTPAENNYQELQGAMRDAAMAADGINVAPKVQQNPFVQQEAGSAEVYSAARELLSLGRKARRSSGGVDEVKFAAEDASPDQRYDGQDIIDALSQIESELGDAAVSDVRLKPRLIEVLKTRHGDHKAFGEELYNTLDVMESLVDSIGTDDFLTDGIRDWIGRLELTLNKLATRDPEFLERRGEEPHSAVQMLNQLGRLGNSKDVRVGIDREVGARVDDLMDRVVKEYDANPEIFEDVLKELNLLVDRQSKAFRGNVERTVRASEGQQKLATARRAVVGALKERLEDKQVPKLLLDLLNPGWRNLLVHTHLRNGMESNEWLDALDVVDQLQAQLSGATQPGSDDYVEPEALLKRVVEGLNSISFEPGKRTPLVMKLSDALIGDTTGEKAEVESIALAVGATEEALGLSGMLPDADPEIESDDELERDSWEKALDRARRLNVGEWLAMSDESGKPLILSTAFVGDDYANFVLVNRKGVKVKELALKEMADGLHERRITLLDDFDLPLMERASQRMLQNMHNKLTYQASHDELTDLSNRREFERELSELIVASRTDGGQHMLLYLDLDQFKIVNNTSGHSAGDELLKQVGTRLHDGLKDTDALVARLGGDEFGVLVRNIETDGAREVAERVLGLVRDHRFDWKGRHYSLSASIGLVFIDQGTADSDAAMRSVDEACYAAKDAGRNRIQEYELGDSRMMRRHGVMEWVTQLDRAVEDDRLVLNCQRIAPVQNGGSNHATSHYEILLTMEDDLGDIMPPAEFILAAETYNRVTVIDRWVIEHVLRWMAEHRDDLDSFGGFAINVSGHSINDETFPDFVLEQFSKSQAPTGKICFEITETAAIGNLDNARDFMNRMKIIGCRFSLDDFGTGLSSYSYLRNLPVDFVKIDGVFVKDLANNPGDYAVVKSINEIGHQMGKQTIAEFVENDEILEQLKKIGVDYAQGYGIEKPCRLEDLRIG